MLKTLLRILLGLLALLLTLVLFLAGSVIVEGLSGPQRLAALTNTTITASSGGPQVLAYVARPDGEGPFPTVIMVHEFFGLNESIVGKADGLADEGYLVIAPDTFRGSTTTWIPRAIYQVVSTPAEQINADLDTVFAWAAAQPEVDPNRIGVLGFCYGGRASLAYSLHNPAIAATVVFYGSPETDPEVLKTLPGPVLGIFGGADQSIPLEEVNAFKAGLDEAGVPNDVLVYDDQPHAFVTDIASIRAGGVQGEAWDRMLAFLAANLKTQPASRPTAPASDYLAAFDWQYYAMLVYEHAFGSAHH